MATLATVMEHGGWDGLIDYLGAQRAHVLGTLDDLDDDALRRPVLPSGWTAVSMVQHLTLDVERFWFAGVIGGDADIAQAGEGEPDQAWIVAADTAPAQVLAAYRDQIEISDLVLGAVSWSDPPSVWPEDLFGTWRLDNAMEIVVHVLAETACHAGHLDAARELIDGRQWMVLTGRKT
jgi:uncharacterized protein DUF664